MKPIKGFLPVDNVFPFQGIDVATPASLLPPSSTPNAINLTTFRGTLEKRGGFARLGGDVGDGTEPVVQLLTFQASNGTTHLLACTPTRLYKLLNDVWVDISPTVTVARFTKFTAGAGWSVVIGSFIPGTYVRQPVTGAVGKFLSEDSTYFYVAVYGGVFDAGNPIASIPNGGTGSITCNGVDANGTSVTVAQFAVGDGVDGWTIITGAFTAGDTVEQETTGAEGIWLGVNGTNYEIHVSSGTFDNTDTIINTRTGRQGTLEFQGSVAAPLTSGKATFPKLALGNGWTADGTFTVGNTVIQAVTGAVGTWETPDGTNFYVTPTFGTFNNKNVVKASTIGVMAQITFAGATPAITTTSRLLASTLASQSLLWTGTEDNYISFVETADLHLGRVIVLTNGVDRPIYWNGTDSTAKVLPINIDSFVTAKCVSVFNSYLVFANISTTEGIEPRTFMWSDTGNVQSWATGNSGVLAETNFEGEILRLIPYSDKLIVFSRNTIGCLCYINPDVIFGVQIFITGTKVAGPGAICNVNPFMVFAGQDNIYLWDGGQSISPIGDKIAKIWREDQDGDYLNRTRMFYDATLGQVRFIMPTGDGEYRLFVLEISVANATFYDLQKSNRTKWLEHIYFYRPICFGLFSNTEAGQTYLSCVIGSEEGKVFVEGGELNDGLNPIEIIWDTQDFTVPQVYKSAFARWYEVEFEASGTSVEVLYSLDQGSTWTSIGTRTLTGHKAYYRMPFDLHARDVRFRFTSNAYNSAFELLWYRIWLRSGGSR